MNRELEIRAAEVLGGKMVFEDKKTRIAVYEFPETIGEPVGKIEFSAFFKFTISRDWSFKLVKKCEEMGVSRVDINQKLMDIMNTTRWADVIFAHPEATTLTCVELIEKEKRGGY